MLDPHQLAAAEHRHEGAADRGLERVRAHPLEPHVEGLVPGAGEIVGAGRMGQPVGAARAHPHRPRGPRHRPAARQSEQEHGLPLRAPAAAPRPLARHGREADPVGGIGRLGLELGPVEGGGGHRPFYDPKRGL